MGKKGPKVSLYVYPETRVIFGFSELPALIVCPERWLLSSQLLCTASGIATRYDAL